MIDSYTVDPENLPEGTVIGESVIQPIQYPLKLPRTAVDLNSLLRSSAFGETVEGNSEESFEVIDSYTVEPENLPEARSSVRVSHMPTENSNHLKLPRYRSGTQITACCVPQSLVKPMKALSKNLSK